MENEHRAKILHSKPKPDAGLSHFHKSIPAGFIVMNDAMPASDADEKEVDVGVAEHGIPRRRGNLGSGLEAILVQLRQHLAFHGENSLALFLWSCPGCRGAPTDKDGYCQTAQPNFHSFHNLCSDSDYHLEPGRLNLKSASGSLGFSLKASGLAAILAHVSRISFARSSTRCASSSFFRVRSTMAY